MNEKEFNLDELLESIHEVAEILKGKKDAASINKDPQPEKLKNPFEFYKGALGSFNTKEEINDWLSDLRDEA